MIHLRDIQYISNEDIIDSLASNSQSRFEFVRSFDVFFSASISQSDSFNLLRHFIIDLIVNCFQRKWKNRIRFAITVDAASLWKWLHMHTNIFKLQIRVESNVYNYSHLDRIPDARQTFD